MIIKYVFDVQKPLSSKMTVTGNSYWKNASVEMGHLYGTQRTWESLKERFRKHIVEKIHLCPILSTEIHRKIAANVYMSLKKSEYTKYMKLYDAYRERLENRKNFTPRKSRSRE